MVYLYIKYGKERLPSLVLGTNKQIEIITIHNITLLPCTVESKPTPGDIHDSYSPSRSVSSI